MKYKITMMILMSLSIACTNSKNAEPEYDYFEVDQKDLVQTIETNGSVEIDNEAQITAPVGGRLDKLFIQEGQEVKKGQRIGSMSSNSRIQILEMAAHKGPKEIRYWEEQILPTYIFAPVTGRVIDIRLREGDDIRGSIATISRGLIIRANIDEVDIAYIKPSQKVLIMFDIQSDQVFEGVLKRISLTSRSVSNVNVYPVEVSLPSKEELGNMDPKIGMSVTLEFPTNEIKDALYVKSNAVNNQANQEVAVLLKNGESKTAQLGDIYETDVHIIEGLELGDEIRVKRFKNTGAKSQKSPLSIFGK